LPDILKYRPKKFWGMLKPVHSTNLDLPTAALANLNESIFFDATIQEDEYRTINDKSEQYISTEEVKHIIQHHFRANKSSGLSQMPLQLIKHLGTTGIEQVTKFLNVTAIDNKPPQSWREAKIVPIYKNRGSAYDPTNYRSIAINTPFAKLFMAIMNKRLT
jgi:hypothetical protein